MKRLILAILVTGAIATSAVAAYKLPLSYRTVYCYPGGSYWQSQINNYPEYYAANKAYYKANYGSTTMYCPTH